MRTIVITGAAGFIGSNATARCVERGDEVIPVDNFSREGSEENAQWLSDCHNVEVRPLDVCDAEAVCELIHRFGPDAVFHLAAQTAVTHSVRTPAEDCRVNIVGTFNVLEGVRKHAPGAHVIYASTNKVYGDLSDVRVSEGENRYHYDELTEGVDESLPLDFRTPYGVSKGAADQYVVDWARTYDLKTTSLRQSCIYGPRQVGVEAQGWVAWFVRAAMAGYTMTIYGDGKQVRDLLYIEDLLKLYDCVLDNPEESSGECFNVGGGREFSMSLLELLGFLERELEVDVQTKFNDWREGDQRVFYSDTTKAQELLGWQPQIEPEEGVRMLIEWVRETPWVLDAVGDK